MSTPSPTAPSALSAFFNFVLAELKVEFIPILIGAIGILQKSPNTLGLAAADAYILANAPAAWLTANQAIIGSSANGILALLQAQLAAGQAAVAAKP